MKCKHNAHLVMEHALYFMAQLEHVEAIEKRLGNTAEIFRINSHDLIYEFDQYYRK